MIELRRGSVRAPESLDELISTREQFLTAYQNAAYARRYRHLVDKVRHVETALGSSRLSTSVATYLFKLMAYKDEYEVARLYTEPAFMEKIKAQFEGDYVLKFHLAPPLLARRDAAGHLIKREFGPWMMRAFGVLARLRFLRGTSLDVFGHTAERRTERALVVEYEQTLLMMLAKLDVGNLEVAIQVASLPEQIRGFGHVKESSMASVAAKRLALLEAFKAPVRELAAVNAAGKVAA